MFLDDLWLWSFLNPDLVCESGVLSWKSEILGRALWFIFELDFTFDIDVLI